jgi:CRISPR-associated protein Csm3
MTQLLGKMLISGRIETKTGLHIGGSGTGLEIGGIDGVVIRDPVTNRPYIPGSSLKGGLRSLLERAEGKGFNKRVGNSMIHMCESAVDYGKCNVCRIFGVSAESIKDDKTLNTLTRLYVRDAKMTEEDALRLEDADTDMPYTEVKTEVVIDRITSAANPRQMERVPPGISFEFEMVYNIFEPEDKKTLKALFDAMSLLEDDYLGGQGSRGYGRVAFKDIQMEWRPSEYYLTGDESMRSQAINGSLATPSQIRQNFEQISEKMVIKGPS